jgi:hypothetical protein
MPDVAVTLIMPDGSNLSARVPRNRHGQLPAVIVDPRDNRGHVVSGMWLEDIKAHWADGTVYGPVQAGP